MKKLIALLICVCAASIMAQANGLSQKAEQKLNAQVEKAARTVQLSVNTGSVPAEFASGNAIIVSSNPTKLVLLTSQSLAIDIDALGDEPVFAKIKQNKKNVPGLIDKITADNPGVNQHFYVITIHVRTNERNTLGRFKPLSLQKARQLLK